MTSESFDANGQVQKTVQSSSDVSTPGLTAESRVMGDSAGLNDIALQYRYVLVLWYIVSKM